jgi:tetratricopeptide (TPR) repeat protein
MDAYYFRRAQESLQRAITPAEALVIRGGNEATSKVHEKALQAFREAQEAAGNDVELRARALLGTMQTQYELKLYQDVIDTSRRLFVLSPQREIWVIPHGYYKLGQAYARLGRKSEAKTALAMVDEFDDYDFQDQLESRVEDELKGLSAP